MRLSTAVIYAARGWSLFHAAAWPCGPVPVAVTDSELYSGKIIVTPFSSCVSSQREWVLLHGSSEECHLVTSPCFWLIPMIFSFFKLTDNNHNMFRALKSCYSLRNHSQVKNTLLCLKNLHFDAGSKPSVQSVLCNRFSENLTVH